MAGSFRDRSVEEEMNRANISEQITVRQGPEARSHTAGFEVCAALARAAACSAGKHVWTSQQARHPHVVSARH